MPSFTIFPGPVWTPGLWPWFMWPGGTYPPPVPGITPTLYFGGTFTVPHVIKGGITPTLRMGMSVRRVKALASTAEGRYNATGRRPILPLLVYDMNVTFLGVTTSGLYYLSDTQLYGLSDTALYAEGAGQAVRTQLSIPDNGSFLVGPTYVPVNGDGLRDFGAEAGAIGTRFVTAGQPDRLTFRRPMLNEVVWYIVPADPDGKVDRGLFRWDGHNWVPYQTLPQRALNGMRVFQTFDPDGIYDYWAKLVGAMYSMASDDNMSLCDLFDPDKCPDDFLGLLAGQVGLNLDLQDRPAVQRQRIRNSVVRSRIRGTNARIQQRLNTIGYNGYASDIFVNPKAADNWTDPVDAPAAVQADVAARNLAIDPNNGQKGTDWFESQHGSAYQEPQNYYPSSRVTIHVNNLDYSMIDLTMAPSGIMLLKQKIVKALADDVLPAHVTVRAFATDDPNSTAFTYF